MSLTPADLLTRVLECSWPCRKCVRRVEVVRIFLKYQELLRCVDWMDPVTVDSPVPLPWEVVPTWELDDPEADRVRLGYRWLENFIHRETSVSMVDSGTQPTDDKLFAVKDRVFTAAAADLFRADLTDDEYAYYTRPLQALNLKGNAILERVLAMHTHLQ